MPRICPQTRPAPRQMPSRPRKIHLRHARQGAEGLRHPGLALGKAKRYFVHSQHRGRRVWKIVGERRAPSSAGRGPRPGQERCWPRSGEGSDERGPASHRRSRVRGRSPTRSFTRYARNWKPSTLKVNRNYYRNHILPRFKGRPIAGIDSRDVRQWFASLHAKPAAADRSAPILSVIMRQAEIYGYRPEGSNPCKGIKRYRREGRERFLSAAEIRSLAAVLDRFEADRPQQVAIIRLLLLTGCRASEVRTLKWRYRREGKLFLPDSKTGPRTIWLSSAAHAILDRVPRTASWMFPSPRTNGPLSHNGLDETWRQIREEADLRDVRLHDLRHSYASTALQHGETVLTIGRLLGHGHPTTTLKYMHWADATVREAVEAVGTVLEG